MEAVCEETEMTKPCPGSGVTHPASCASTLCYCGRTFRRRFRSFKPWTVPEHEQREIIIPEVDAREVGFELV